MTTLAQRPVDTTVSWEPAPTGQPPAAAPTPTPTRRGHGFFADLSTSRKLAGLAAACLAPSLVVGVVGWVSMANIEEDQHGIESLRQVSAKLYHLDNRNSEIKADGFRSMIGGNLGTVVSDTSEDIASAEAVIDEALSHDMPTDLRAEIEAVVPASQEFYSFVQDFVNASGAGSRVDVRNEGDVVDANHELDAALEELRGSVDEAIEAADAELDDDQAQVRATFVGALLLGVVLAALLATWIGRMITRRLRRAVLVLEAVSNGALDERLVVDSGDEIGQMGEALNAALAALGSAMSQMDTNAQALASASDELSAVSGQMSGTAQESSSQASLVSAAAEQVSRNVQTVATGTEEMSASIREIAQNATSAASVAAQAVMVAESTNHTVAKLGESSTEVGNVIKVINSIAEQTNLLALNATIEAARAGEAGKGFAVVANEVKELAQETSKATEDISRRIEAIQGDTEAAVAAIAEIAGIIGQINDTQNTIASAVEEQTATTNEMSRNVAEAATGSADIAQNVTGVARSASDTQAAASSTSQAAEELARMAAQMRSLVGQFRF